MLQTKGTRLSLQPIKRKPLTQWFLGAMGGLFLVTMHTFMHNPGGSGLALPFNQATWIPLSFAIGVGLLEICRQQHCRYTHLTLLLFVCAVLLTLPLFYPHSTPEHALPRLLTVWAGWLLFVATQQFVFSHRQRQRLLWFILLAVLIEAALGWVQFLLLTTDNPIGYNTAANRPYGIFQQPNVMASFMATGLVLSAYLMAREPLYRGRWHYRHLPLLLTPVMTIPLLLVLGSRTGLWGGLIGGLMILPFLIRFAAKTQYRLWLLMCLLGGAMAFNWLSSPDTAFREMALTFDGGRTVHIPQNLKMLQTKPLMGYGYGNFESSYIMETAHWYQQGVINTPSLPGLEHAHNELLFWAVEGGILPLLGLLLAALAVYLRVKRAKAGTHLALVAICWPIILHTQLEYPFYHSIAHFVVFIVLIYWIDNLTAKYYKKTVNHTLNIRLAACSLPLSVTLVMLSGLQSGYWLTQFERQRPVNPVYLTNVSNPYLWQQRFDWNLHTTELQVGAATAEFKLIESYIDWATQQAKQWPRPSLYQNLILAYALTEENDKRLQLYEEATFLFPNHSFSLLTDIESEDDVAYQHKSLPPLARE
ncbi:Wzy polymerase domain-containing protein [Thaumasiovibrio sp. DFM-14]|uniref:PglL family O-oligosaccharyltransferase n=1 Tax=Thaumasiovibrio sp. DFM-14 TaxID=3384792 RepID=UPI0039A28CEF